MTHISTIGIDLAKSVFHIHGVDDAGEVVVQKKFRRAQLRAYFAKLPPCLVGMEACAGAHYWSRELLALGHQVRLMPPAYVKPYVRRQKNDANDAAAICEAVRRPSMRFVSVKSEAAQALLGLHRARDILIRQRTAAINALRAHLSEFGIIAPRGAGHGRRLARRLLKGEIEGLPDLMATALASIARTIMHLDQEITALDGEIKAAAWRSHRARLLMSIPGIGPITASALCATLGDARAFRSGRELAAFLGLVPRQNSSGGKTRLGGISKMGDAYLRRLLTVGARSVLSHAERRAESGGARALWILKLKREKPYAVAAGALANKMARIVFALLRSNEVYRDEVYRDRPVAS